MNSSFATKTQCLTTPAISIIVDDCESPVRAPRCSNSRKKEDSPVDDTDNVSLATSPNLFKCKSMLNIDRSLRITKLTLNSLNPSNLSNNLNNRADSNLNTTTSENDAKFNIFKNLLQINMNTNLLTATSKNLICSSSRKLARKCLSRLNLNNKLNKDFSDLSLQQASSVSIMNLDKFNNQANKLNTNPSTNRYLYFKSSQANLYDKSSTSLNALLDLDMFESVSISSFDRLSLYSECCANSVCDLNTYYLIESTQDLAASTATNQSTDLSQSWRKRRQSLQIDDKSYTGCFTKQNNSKVMDWLQKF